MSDAKMDTWIDIAPGVHRRTIASGPHMMQIFVRLDAGSHVPEHRHVHEQIAFCVSGMLRLTVEGKPHDIHPGQSFYLKSNIPHSADVFEDTIVIDTFSPPREDMLKQDAERTR